MRGTILTHMGMSHEEAVERLLQTLSMNGCEISTKPNQYRVLMFRRNKKQWTQVYKAKHKSWRLRVSGPEIHLIEKKEA